MAEEEAPGEFHAVGTVCSVATSVGERPASHSSSARFTAPSRRREVARGGCSGCNRLRCGRGRGGRCWCPSDDDDIANSSDDSLDSLDDPSKHATDGEHSGAVERSIPKTESDAIGSGKELARRGGSELARRGGVIGGSSTCTWRRGNDGD